MSEDKQDQSYKYGLSAKIKKIFIELHGYSFFHSPSEIRNVDKRFIGREKIKNKLKAILVNSDTKSGAYLVTGYRGMGKSSFVSKAIEEIDPSRTRPFIFEKILRIFALLLFLSFFQIWSFQLPVIVSAAIVSAVILMFTSLYLFRSDHNRNDLKICKKEGLIEHVLWPILNTFVIIKSKDSENKFREFIQVIHLTVFIHLITILLSQTLF
ncbi:MAG: ATP-binding protein, partial [bacterium]|nr:ATP-binding protein [bacterium]